MGVDRLDPTQRALVLVTGRATENNLAEEMQGEHDAHADPVAKNRSIQQTNRQPVPQKQKNPALQTVDAEHQTQAEQEYKDEHQTSAFLVHINQLVFHNINSFLDFVLKLYHILLRLSRPFQYIFSLE